jgi:ribosomal protein L3 glutamine methyltransferase
MLDDYLEGMPLKDNTLNVLELCTGSGCLPILFKHTYQHAFKNLHIDATDICPNALAVAQHNITQYHYNDYIKLHEASLFANIKPAKQYDIIFSNPPYVCTQSMENLPKAYLYEPHIALAGGLDGMDLVKPIIKQANQYLKADGVLVIEIGNDYAMAMFDAMNIESVCWLGVSAGHQQVFLLQAWQIRHLR